MKKNSIILASLFLFGACVVDYMQCSPAGETLDPIKKEIIEKFINISSDEIAQDLKKDDRPAISDKFQKYLETNEKAGKVFQVYQDGTGEFSMQIINLEEYINQKFKNKTDELNDKNKTAIQKEIGSKAIMWTGALVMIGGVFCGANLDGAVGGVVGTVGAGVTFGGWKLQSWSLDKQFSSKAHIEQNIVMHEKWRNKFNECKKEQKKN